MPVNRSQDDLELHISSLRRTLEAHKNQYHVDSQLARSILGTPVDRPIVADFDCSIEAALRIAACLCGDHNTDCPICEWHSKAKPLWSPTPALCAVCGRIADFNDNTRCDRHQNMYMPHGHPKHRNLGSCIECNMIERDARIKKSLFNTKCARCGAWYQYHHPDSYMHLASRACRDFESMPA